MRQASGLAVAVAIFSSAVLVQTGLMIAYCIYWDPEKRYIARLRRQYQRCAERLRFSETQRDALEHQTAMRRADLNSIRDQAQKRLDASKSFADGLVKYSAI
jgi:hypothetical protein